jgi:glutathione reductase (NADPH)
VGAPANRTVTAKTILIATGTTPTAIDIPGKEHCISSDHILELPQLPKRLAILGAGYVACEFACMFALWGTQTHVIYRKALPLAGFDDDCRAAIARQMESVNGVRLAKETTPVRVEKQPDGRYSVHTRTLDGVEGVLADCDEVLMATGRHANVAGLGLEKAGVEMNGNRVQVRLSGPTPRHLYGASWLWQLSPLLLTAWM